MAAPARPIVPPPPAAADPLWAATVLAAPPPPPPTPPSISPRPEAGGHQPAEYALTVAVPATVMVTPDPRHERKPARLLWIGSAAIAVLAFAIVAFVVFGDSSDDSTATPGDSTTESTTESPADSATESPADSARSAAPTTTLTGALSTAAPSSAAPGAITVPTAVTTPGVTVAPATIVPVTIAPVTIAPVTIAPPVTVAPLATMPPVTTQPPPTTAALEGDLGLTQPISRPGCDNRYITLIGGVVTADAYATQVQATLDQYPGSNYLRAELVCSSLRARAADGTPIYIIYFGPFSTASEACTARAFGPADAYVKILDNVADPATRTKC